MLGRSAARWGRRRSLVGLDPATGRPDQPRCAQGRPEHRRGLAVPSMRKRADAAGSASHVDALPGALSTFLGVSMRTPDGINNWVVELQGWGALVVDAI